jgi:hypothetical protein
MSPSGRLGRHSFDTLLDVILCLLGVSFLFADDGTVDPLSVVLVASAAMQVEGALVVSPINVRVTFNEPPCDGSRASPSRCLSVQIANSRSNKTKRRLVCRPKSFRHRVGMVVQLIDL